MHQPIQLNDAKTSTTRDDGSHPNAIVAHYSAVGTIWHTLCFAYLRC